jgi:hypothetical protein
VFYNVGNKKSEKENFCRGEKEFPTRIGNIPKGKFDKSGERANCFLSFQIVSRQNLLRFEKYTRELILENPQSKHNPDSFFKNIVS